MNRFTFTLYDADQIEQIEEAAAGLLTGCLAAWKEENPDVAKPSPVVLKGLQEQARKDAEATVEPHQYEVMRHNPEVGAPIMFELQGLVAGPLGAILPGVMASGSAATIDASAIGEALRSALGSLRDMRLVYGLLAHTTRDGKPLNVTRSKLAFHEAYQGNYGELQDALWEVIKVNRFLSLPAGLRSVLGGLGLRLTASAKQPSEPPLPG